MVTAELIHNPYLLHTSVKFNGQSPRINSQVEKYEAITLKDWIEKVPQIYHDEMNGYDFDLSFTGTKSDFDSLRKAFSLAGVSEEMVRLFHKNELQDAETKSHAIDDLINWLRTTPNRKFDFSVFYSAHSDLFDGAYPYIVINGPAAEDVHPQINMELVKDSLELESTYLTNTPILFFVDPFARKQTREDLRRILNRTDVKQNQLFFIIHPKLDMEQVRRVIVDLGVDNPQIVTSYGDETVLMYLRDYPITEFIREAIKVLDHEVCQIAEILEKENKESEIQNAEIHAVIDSIELQLNLLKEADLFFSERDNYNARHSFSNFSNILEEQITKWRNRKTKVVGDNDCQYAAEEYSTDLRRFQLQYITSVKDTYIKLADEILLDFKTEYLKQGLDLQYEPADIILPELESFQIPDITEELVSLKVVTYEEPKYDLMALFRMSSQPEEKEPVRVATCYYAQWREKALEYIIPIISKLSEQAISKLDQFYNDLAEAYHKHLSELIVEQDHQKNVVSSQLSDDERLLQEDNDWLAAFREQLTHIERD